MINSTVNVWRKIRLIARTYVIFVHQHFWPQYLCTSIFLTSIFFSYFSVSFEHHFFCIIIFVRQCFGTSKSIFFANQYIKEVINIPQSYQTNLIQYPRKNPNIFRFFYVPQPWHTTTTYATYTEKSSHQLDFETRKSSQIISLGISQFMSLCIYTYVGVCTVVCSLVISPRSLVKTPHDITFYMRYYRQKLQNCDFLS